jgi:hypothetical protein
MNGSAVGLQNLRVAEWCTLLYNVCVVLGDRWFRLKLIWGVHLSGYFK